jgi:hypothetical protein
MNCATSSPRKRVGIIQSSYIPWKGYFDFIASVDEFVIFDDVQYTRRDWRSRNRIKTKDGVKWITVPVETKGRYLANVDQIPLAGTEWVDEHMATLRHAYGKAPHFRDEWPWISETYEAFRSMTHLSQVNVVFIRAIVQRLGIPTPIRLSSEFKIVPGKNERLLSICEQVGADAYLSGPAAQDYIDEMLWDSHGIKVAYKSYEGYPEYPQLHGSFEHAVSILDLFVHVGPESSQYFRANQ